jgi:hypothetical protein
LATISRTLEDIKEALRYRPAAETPSHLAENLRTVALHVAKLSGQIQEMPWFAIKRALGRS